MEQITIPQIRVLDAVAKENNFSKAAVLLGISQPAVSIQLRELQKRYGINIYYRRGKKIMLSELGLELVTTGRKVLGLLNEMDTRIRETAELFSGKLHIGLSCHYFVKRLLPRFIEDYPGVSVKASIGHSARLKEEVKACRMDIAEITDTQPDPHLFNLKFSEQKILLFVAQSHAWAGLSHIDITRLDNVKMVALHNESMTRQIFNKKLDEKGINPNIVLELDNWETMKETVAAGIGFGIALEDEFGPDHRLAKIALKGARFTANQYFVCQPEYRELKVVSAFLEIAAKESEKNRILKQIKKEKKHETSD
ncbi:LysR family transcriptional regulator [Desulfospira joergensenii]|uniref:LysR family transcriptional regulator n=1 Tax=Desulfospira joergensenii TaxID=53329 RepID=UPI0003B3B0FE|nr:LysR family transcriptional regulator [Desulfospira joergensenii]